MTIHTYYHIFGFLVPINECLKVLGFTPDKLTPEKRREVIDECGFDSDEDEEKICEYWFEYEARETFAAAYSFNINDSTYTVRSFCHDNPDSEKYYVVGVLVGEMARFKGKYTQVIPDGNSPKCNILNLSKNPDWQKAIQMCKNQTTTSKKIEYGVPDPKYKDSWILPSIYTTTDDCDCCS